MDGRTDRQVRHCNIPTTVSQYQYPITASCSLASTLAGWHTVFFTPKWWSVLSPSIPENWVSSQGKKRSYNVTQDKSEAILKSHTMEVRGDSTT
jgi:hypothetical protein